MNDCEKVNEGINDILDTADYIKEQYFLEVSSTGLEKILRKDEHLKQNIEKEIQVNLFKPIEISGKKIKEIIGILKNFNVEQIEITQDKETIKLDRKNISQIKTVYDWNSIKEDNF